MLRKCNSSIFEIEHGSMGRAFSWGGKRDTKSVTRPRAARRRHPRKPPKSACQKVVPPLQKCAKNGVFGRKSVHFRSICAQFCTKMTSFADIAPRYRAASPSGKNPPIYTVLNAAFSAPGPPACGTVVGHQFPTPSHGLPTPISPKSLKSDFSEIRWWE